MGERRGRLSPDDAEQFLSNLQSAAIFLDRTPPLTLPLPLLALARNPGLAAYDAAYLELAYRLHLPLATVAENRPRRKVLRFLIADFPSDERLRQAAARLGVLLL
jgi:predicted nucleic acid-binding protein